MKERIVILFRLLAVIPLFVLAAPPMFPERLPVRTYSSTDGLVMDGAVFQIMQDSVGFLWFVTEQGISRFDGQSFRNFDSRDGLPLIDHMLETKPGEYWLATERYGLIRYDPTAPAAHRFISFRIGSTRHSNEIETLLGDKKGGLWIGAEDGLYHAAPTSNGLRQELVLRPQSPPHSEPDGHFPVSFMFQDSRGVLWVTANYSGVYCVRPDGRIEHYTVRDGLPRLIAGPVLEDHAGRMWLAAKLGFFQLDAHPQPGRPLVLRRFDTLFGNREVAIQDILETRDGHIWMASAVGLLEFDGQNIRRYTTRNGLPQDALWSVLVDRQGNMWVGTDTGGVARINRDGFTTCDESDGIPRASIASARVVNGAGFVAITRRPLGPLDIRQLVEGEPAKFRAIRPLFPREVTGYGWGSQQILMRDRAGGTWFATHDGVARFAPTPTLMDLGGRLPAKLYTMRDGLPSNNVYSLFEDSHGTIWAGLMFGPQFGMARLPLGAGRFEDLNGVPGTLPHRSAAVFAESLSGSLWIGMFAEGLTRFRDNRFVSFLPAGGLPSGSINALYVDPGGAIWGATGLGGVFRIEDPDSDRPHFTTFTEADGLATNQYYCITGGPDGRIYAGSFKGVDRIDPVSREILHYNTGDGLANNIVHVCSTDNLGRIWFGTDQGLSRLTVRPSNRPTISPARITAVQVSGRTIPISDLGETGMRLPPLPADKNNLRISFAAISFTGQVQYRYMLEGLDKEWSKPSTQQIVDYVLRPGPYRFLAQALGGSTAPTPPATLTFQVLAPLWQRWWFLLVVAIALAGATYALYRFRLQQLLAVERVRMRIATDLHDDIGSALSHIGLLSETARPNASGTVRDSLERIASVSRETAAAMSDIIWMVKPSHDCLRDVTIRIRQFASEAFSARDIECTVSTPEFGDGLRLGIDTRRQLLLVAKEAIHNAVKHSHATKVAIEITQERGQVLFRILDNGEGFDPLAATDGNGIASMRSRAEKVGGTLKLSSTHGRGTCVELRVPC